VLQFARNDRHELGLLQYKVWSARTLRRFRRRSRVALSDHDDRRCIVRSMTSWRSGHDALHLALSVAR
jgi:hypothetical protein